MLNTCMNTYKNIKDDGLTDAWLRSAGIDSKRLTAERIELQHAQRLATQMLKQNRAALAQNQALCALVRDGSLHELLPCQT